MVKQSSEKSTSKNQNSNKVSEIKITLNSQNLSENKPKKKNVKKESVSVRTDFIKKECVVPDIENLENVLSFEKNSDTFDNLPEKNSKLKKKSYCKLIKETEENRMEFLSNFSHLRLSQSVIVNSVLKSTKIDQNLGAILPESLNLIYNKFINNKHYTDYLHSKDDFFCGVGLFGINIEEKIYNKRKALEDSLKRGIRLRPNPKPTKLFDGTVINRPSRNYNHGPKIMKSVTRPIVLRGKTKYNLFNIGIDSTKKKNRRPIRKPIKKKLNNNSNRSLNDKTELKKEIMNSGSSEEETDDLNAKSIAFTRPKRLQKVPKLDFKYCYGDRMMGVVTANRKFGDSNSDGGKSGEYGRDVMEIVDSDSSSVVEVSPPNDGDISEESDGGLGKSKENQEKSKKVKCALNMRKGWRPKESKALNLLDKLRLGLQCRIIQTEHDIIIQNLSLEDLATLQSRIQGLATFKNIEAEYDKNGQETARATIDRKLLNLPTKSGLENEEMKAPLSRKYEESLKRKPLSSQIIKCSSIDRKKIVLDDLSKSLKTHQVINGNYKPEECPSVWIRPKGRSVKKVRKLYTQSGSTPNILSRSQMSNRSDNHLMTSSSRTASTQSGSKNTALSFSQASPIISTDSVSHNQHTTSVSFYSQLSTIASSISPVSVIAKPIMSNETLKPVSALSSTSVAVQVANVDVVTTPIIPTATPIMATTIDSLNTNTVTNIVSNSSLTPPSISLESPRKSPIAVEKILPPPPPILMSTSNQRTIDLVSPATAMSASQLLMLKRGGSQNVNDSGSASNSVVGVVNSTDQLYTNQILKPFKKTLVTSSPPKLELDDEEVEADFELTPSMITQVKNIAVPITLSNSQTVQNKHTFLSKPLIQASGILPNSRRTISLTNTPLFQAQNSLLNSPNQLQSCCVAVSNKSLTVIEKPIVCVVPAQPIGLPNTGITTTANNNISTNTNITNIQNTSPNQNIKFKQRKWTHNFHTSNSINFREVLCTTRPNNVQPILSSHVQLSISNSVSSVNNSAKPITIPNTISTNTINPLRTPDKSNQIPSKGSSAVLKSLLVGSHSSNDLCNLNKSANWASKYLSSTSSLQDSSKIKWQVGGTVITSLPQNLMSPVSKESTPLEIVNSNNSK